MALIPHTVDLVVKDMARTLAFYRLLGLAVPAESDEDPQVEAPSGAGWSMGFVTEELARRANPMWRDPVGQRITVAFRCDSPGEVDETARRVGSAGHVVLKAPWDAFWGQRYAFLQDPDGNRVDLFAALVEA